MLMGKLEELAQKQMHPLSPGLNSPLSSEESIY